MKEKEKHAYLHFTFTFYFGFRLGIMSSKETRQHSALLCVILNQQELEQVLMKTFG